MVRRRRSSFKIPGFSWKRALGITAAKQRFARKTGIPTTKAGLQRKLGREIMKAGGCMVFIVISLSMSALLFWFFTALIV
ncbi:MAG: hypothetical protein LBV23_10110 [Deltaproteobacteria bacterium]|nr:hypothetical protein [Deltaproteobacteria bacterium]